MLAYKRNEKETLKFLIESGADCGLISHIVNKKKWDDALRFLIDFGASSTRDDLEKILNAVFGPNMTVEDEKIIGLSRYAAKFGHKFILEHFVQLGHHEKKDKEGRTIAHYAAEFGQKNILEYLIEEQDDDGKFILKDLIEERDNEGKKPEFYAAKNKQTEVLKFLFGKALEIDDWEKAISLMTEHGAPFKKTELEKILDAVYTLEMTAKREQILDFLQELGLGGFSVLTN